MKRELFKSGDKVLRIDGFDDIPFGMIKGNIYTVKSDNIHSDILLVEENHGEWDRNYFKLMTCIEPDYPIF